MRWSVIALICLLPGAQAALQVTDFAAPAAPIALGGVGYVNFTVAVDCTDITLRALESPRIDLTISPADEMQVDGETSHTIPVPTPACASSQVYTWSPSLTVRLDASAIGLKSYPLGIAVSVPNATLAPADLAPVLKTAQIEPAYDGRIDVNLNGTIENVGDGQGSISVWVENLGNARTQLKLKIASAEEGTVTLPPAPALDTPLEGGRTGTFLVFAFKAPFEWSGESEFDIEVTPYHADDIGAQGPTKIVELVFSEDGSSATVRDKGSPAPFLVAPLALAGWLRRRA